MKRLIIDAKTGKSKIVKASDRERAREARLDKLGKKNAELAGPTQEERIAQLEQQLAKLLKQKGK